MTDGERIATAVAISLALHWAALSTWQVNASPVVADEEITFNIDLSGPDIGVSLAAPITLEQAASAPAQNDEAAAAADRRRTAMLQYLDQVTDAIHARRRIEGRGGGLIGNALFRIVIDANGRFADVVLLRGSGDNRLDADAIEAVRAASGAVPRPRILGNGAIAVMLAVKYQLGL